MDWKHELEDLVSKISGMQSSREPRLGDLTNLMSGSIAILIRVAAEQEKRIEALEKQLNSSTPKD